MKSIMIAAILAGLSTIIFAAPSTLTQIVIYNGETITMRLTQENLRGPHFELWSQNASGGYDVVTPVEERSYIGSVDEYPGAVSCGILLDDGQFKGAVYFTRGGTWRTLGTAVTGTRALDYEEFLDYQFPTASSTTEGLAGTDMCAFDLAVDAEYDYFTQAGSSLAATLEGIEYSICLVRAFYMRDLLLYPRLGRVVVRATLAHDPYVGLYGSEYLNALKTEWETNHSDADRDLSMGVSPNKVGGGLAWTGTVGTSLGYSVSMCDSSGDFDVVFRHEFGHNWGSGHFVGGKPEGYGIMGGNQPARFSGCEAYVILNYRNTKIAAGGILDNMGFYTNIDLPPYASMDAVTVLEGSSVLMDVLANDHDANAETLSIKSFDAVSRYGTPVTLSTGTGAGGRDELIYSSANEAGTDYILYTIEDSSGQTAQGVVLVNIEAVPLSVLQTDADTYVRDWGNHHGQEQTVIVKRVNDNPRDTYNRTGWIHFDVSTFAFGQSVQLRFPIDADSDPDANGKLRVWGIVDGRPGDTLGDDWTESGIEMFSTPMPIPFTEGSDTSFIGEVECGQPGENIFISGEDLLAFLAADTNGEVTFLLSREVDNGLLEISSRESASGGVTLETIQLPNADAYVRGGQYADSNFGSTIDLNLKTLSSNPGYTRESFLRFVYDDITEPITSATLKLMLERKDSSTGNIRVRLLDDADDYWGEDSITWNTKPAASGLELSIPVSDLEVGVEYSIDVSTLLTQPMNANRIASFQLDLDTGTAVEFYSREAGFPRKPTLDLRTADTDHDGIPDEWENAHSLDPLLDDAAGDDDSDGLNNWFEYVADTDPQDDQSKQEFSVELLAGGTNVVLRCGTSSNRLYCVEYRNSLMEGMWQELDLLFSGTGLETNITDASITTQCYYRLRVELLLDTEAQPGRINLK